MFATAEKKKEIRYRVSADGVIEDIGGAWDEFAAENAAGELVESRPVGTPFLEHVAGTPVRMLMSSLLERSREESRPLEFRFRCDSPDCRRFMRLRLEPETEGSVVFRSWIEREEPRDPVLLLEPSVSRSSDMLRVCAWCRRADVGGEWVELEEAVDQLGLFESGPVPEITHDICARCANAVLADGGESEGEGA